MANLDLFGQISVLLSNARTQSNRGRAYGIGLGKRAVDKNGNDGELCIYPSSDQVLLVEEDPDAEHCRDFYGT